MLMQTKLLLGTGIPMRKSYAFSLLFLLLSVVGFGQVNMTTTSSYSQDFNTLPSTGTTTWTNNTTLTNWYAASFNNSFVVDNGSGNSGGLRSYGSTSASDRALGSLGSNTPTSPAYGIVLRNTSGGTITDIKVSYTGEQWRNGGNTASQPLAFYYGTSSSPITSITAGAAGYISVSALNFISKTNTGTAAALDGNLSTNKTVFTNIAIPSLSLANNDYIILKWDDINDSGNDHGLAIDDVTISWTVTPSVLVPTVSTTTVSGITSSGASSGGNVTADGGASVTAKGVYFGTSATPISGTSNGAGTGNYTSTLSPLTINTQYFYRAYATNSVGTGYGSDLSFYTLANTPTTPTVATPATTSLNVSITSGDGNPAITQYAIYETSTNQFVQADGSLGATPVWQTASTWGTKTVMGLAASTTYTFQTKARNGDNVETAYSTAASGTTLADETLTFANLQHPPAITVAEGAITEAIYAKAYKAGYTDVPPTVPVGLQVWIGISPKDAPANSNPNTWTKWIPASWFSQEGNDDQYAATINTLTEGLVPGTYRYASRLRINTSSYSYGGYNGGFWNGTSNLSGTLTVTANKVNWANIQSPVSGTIVQGNAYTVYSQVYKPGVTGNGNSHSGITAWIGYNSSNVAPSAAGWTWVLATRNTGFSNDANDEYSAEIGSGRTAGVYYYASRYQMDGSSEYFYGGHAGGPNTGGEWGNPVANVSGVLTVQTPREINIKQGSTNTASGGSYAFGNQPSGTSSTVTTFTVENTGQESLSVGALTISGANASEFTITQVVSGTVNGGTSTTFTVTFSPTSSGPKVAQLSLVNDDANENPYVINLTGIAGPVNDLCSNATTLTVNAAATTGTLAASTFQAPFDKNDVWYSFTPSCTGQLTVTLNDFFGADLGFTIWASNCPTVTTGSVVDRDNGNTGIAETHSTYSYVGGTTYYLRVWKYSGTDTTFNIRITSPNLGAPTTITANPTTFCSGATVTFTATTVTNATSYSWTVPGDWTITGYPTVNTMTATVGATAGSVRAKAINCYGEGVERAVNFTPGVIPATPTAITGSATVCQSASNIYSVAAVSGATSYTWTLPSGWSGISTTNSITTTAGSIGGTISVTANSTCGSSIAQTLSVIVNPNPTTPNVPISDNATCGNVILTRGTPPAGEAWYWQGTNANGTTETDSNVTYTATTSGTYYLRSKNTTTGCWSVASSASVTVNSATTITTQPANQSATTGGTATFSVVATGSGLSYQWQVDNNLGGGFVNISGANSASYTTPNTTLAMNDYKYRVVITGTCGSATSNGNATLTVADIIFANGDYRSTNNGNWHGTAANGTGNTWEQLQSGVWTSISNSPPSNAASLGSNKVYVRHDISLVGTNTAPYVVILQDGILTSNVTVTFGNLLVKTGGVFNRMNNATGMNSLGIFEIEDGGYAYITQTDSSVPSIWAGTEKFHPSSNLVIKRLDAGTILRSSTTVSPYTDANGNSAYFGNLIIESSVDMSIVDGVNATATRITNGDLILRTGTSGTSSFVFVKGAGTSGYATPFIVGGDFIIENTFSGTAALKSGTATSTYVKVNGDFIMNGNNTYRMSTVATGVYLLVEGNMNIRDTSKFYFVSPSGNVAGFYYVSLKGDITVEDGATFTNNNTNGIGNAIVYFAGNGDGSTEGNTQTIDIAPTVGSNAKIDFNLIWPAYSSTPYVKLAKDLNLGTNSAVNVRSNATLDFGFNGSTPNNIIGGNAFTAETASTLKITSPNGIMSSGATGNVQTTTRTFASGGDYHYIGKTNQVTGSALPTDVRNLTIHNEGALNDVTLSGNVAVNQTLKMTQGNIVSNGYNFTLGSNITNKGLLDYTSGFVKGTMRRWFNGGNSGNGTGLFPLGNTANQNRFALIEFASTSTGGILSVSGTEALMGNSGVSALPSIAAVGSCSAFKVISTDDFYWKLTPTTLVGNYSSHFTKQSTSTDPICENTILNRTGTDWEIHGTHLSPSGTPAMLTVSRSGLSNFTDFGIGSGRCGNENIWTGSWSNGTPNLNQKIKFDATYNSASHGGSVSGCECEVSSGVILDFDSTSHMELTKGLHNNGTIRLENAASLVQNLDGITNTGTGTIEMKRITTPMYRYDFTYWSSPLEESPSFTLNTLSPGTLPDKYFKWNTLTQNWQTLMNGASPMDEGIGYIVRAPQSYAIEGQTGATPQPYMATFTGKPNNGMITVPVVGGTDQWNLIGNPYPSAIDADDFILHSGNENLDGTLYFWTHNSPPALIPGDAIYNYSSDDYASYNLTGATATAIELPAANGGTGNNNNAPDGTIPAGQSFFVLGDVAGDAVFSNTMRTTGPNSNFYRQQNNTTEGRVWLNLVNDTRFHQMLIGYVDQATNGKDRGFDGILMGGSSANLSSLIGTEKFTIQGRSLPFEITDEVPLSVSFVTAGNYKILIDHLDGFFNTQDIFLKDNNLNVIHNLKTAPYEFTTTTGNFNNRFVLVYRNSSLDKPEFDLAQNQVYVLNQSEKLLVKSIEENLKTVVVYDLLGREIHRATDIQTKEYPITGLLATEQTLLIHIELENGMKTTKKAMIVK